MVSQDVTLADGRVVRVHAEDDAALKAAAKAIKNDKAPETAFDINEPVEQGHDLVIVDGAFGMRLGHAGEVQDTVDETATE